MPGSSGVAQKRSSRPEAWAFDAIWRSFRRWSAGIGPSPFHVNYLPFLAASSTRARSTSGEFVVMLGIPQPIISSILAGSSTPYTHTVIFC